MCDIFALASCCKVNKQAHKHVPQTGIVPLGGGGGGGCGGLILHHVAERSPTDQYINRKLYGYPSCKGKVTELPEFRVKMVKHYLA